ncbi:hypothetical protein CH371_19795 [Leptospira wolffii]|uniref:Bacteriophage T5 Orf172 DNA-binding domain-containing protein n=1 Tax=Leptospira wolffii TaxID=409998 RepID=A0A2M9Z6Q2_9LEPT|nr:GIY-YIG nuclease family protein [Leptospira wolffii]PJZ64109.1 hypothetical protein CH371_19795 [Leptospira wolffii]
MAQAGIVYVFTNPAMPGIVKIGMTTRDQIDDRLRELYTTSVPVPFDCAHASRVEDCEKVEKALHIAFGPSRVNPQREFFKIDPEQAIAILSLFEKENISNQVVTSVNKTLDQVDIEAGKKLNRQRRPHMNFVEMGIPIGSKLQFTDSESKIEVEVISERKIKYNNQELSLTRLTSDLLELDYDVQPARYWLFEGKALSVLYESTYGE